MALAARSPKLVGIERLPGDGSSEVDEACRIVGRDDVVTRAISGHATEAMEHHYNSVGAGSGGSELAPPKSPRPSDETRSEWNATVLPARSGHGRCSRWYSSRDAYAFVGIITTRIAAATFTRAALIIT